MSFQNFRGIEYDLEKNCEESICLSSGEGYYIINDFISKKLIAEIHKDLLGIEKVQIKKYEIKKESPEYGQVRSPFLSSNCIKELLCSKFLLGIVKKHLVGNGICHLLNGQIIRKENLHNQSLWHRDFNKAQLSNPLLAFNTLFFLGEYKDINNYSTLQNNHSFEVIDNSQKMYGPPNKLLNHQKKISLRPGSILVFNSQLWHRVSNTKNDQLFLNIMFTEPFIKQQINLLGANIDWVNKYSNINSELARLIGWWSRPPEDINEFRNPKDNLRTYRQNQG